MPNSEFDRVKTGSRATDDQRRRVLQTAKRLSAVLSSDFYYSLVSNLATVLEVEGVYVGALVEGSSARLRTLAVVWNRRAARSFEQQLPGTASGQVLSDGMFACSKDVLRIFPHDSHLKRVGAEGYAGIRLSDSAGQPLGVLAVVGKEPLADLQLAKSVLETFAPGVAEKLEHKRSDDIHRENEERYNAFIAGNPDAMWRLEFEQPISLDQPDEQIIDQLYRFGYLAECNDALARLFGRERAEELQGFRFETFAPRADEQMQKQLRSSIRTGFRSTIAERVVPHDDGSASYRLRTEFGIVENRHLCRLWGSTRDITDLRRAELATAASERRFGEVLEGIHIPAVMLDSRGAISFCNESFVRLTQRSRSDLAETTWLGGIVPANEIETWKAAISTDLTTDGEAVHFDGEVIPLHGQHRQIAWDAICLRSRDNRGTALAAVGRDLTHQKALEVEIWQANKLDAIGRLAAGVAHDFNNLLTVVLGNASHLLALHSESDPSHRPLSDIVDATTQCTRLTQRLLALGRREPIRPQLIDLNQVISEIEGILRGLVGSAITMTIKRAPRIPLVVGDSTQMQEVLLNLVSNARDAMPRGGSLEIATANVVVEHEDPDHPGIDPGEYLQLSVVDSGTGLADGVQQHIFEPFFTTKPHGEGTGLGLATVYAIVKQTGGHIAVRSETGKGAEFKIMLPAASPVMHKP